MADLPQLYCGRNIVRSCTALLRWPPTVSQSFAIDPAANIRIFASGVEPSVVAARSWLHMPDWEPEGAFTALLDVPPETAAAGLARLLRSAHASLTRSG